MVLMTELPPTDVPIALHDVAIGYDDRPAVTGIDFELRRGEVVALVGPNGAGKTTLVRGVLGLADVLAGEVRLFGEPADRFRARYRIGYVPQRHTVGGAIPSTVQEVVASGRLPRKPLWGRTTKTDRAAVRDAIETVGLGELCHCPVSILSGGQQRRTLIARALAAQPEVLVMDEPTAGVDPANQASLARTLGRLVEQGMTLLIVTHEIAPLLPILTRVVTVDGGRIASDLPPEAALAAAGQISAPASSAPASSAPASSAPASSAPVSSGLRSLAPSGPQG
jgi:zinc transport system ATP-binding protein